MPSLAARSAIELFIPFPRTSPSTISFQDALNISFKDASIASDAPPFIMLLAIALPPHLIEAESEANTGAHVPAVRNVPIPNATSSHAICSPRRFVALSANESLPSLMDVRSPKYPL